MPCGRCLSAQTCPCGIATKRTPQTEDASKERARKLVWKYSFRQGKCSSWVEFFALAILTSSPHVAAIIKGGFPSTSTRGLGFGVHDACKNKSHISKKKCRGTVTFCRQSKIAHRDNDLWDVPRVYLDFQQATHLFYRSRLV